MNKTSQELCTEFRSKHMQDFADEVFSIDFKERPNYGKLRFLLERNLLNLNIIPDKNYDWNTSENDCF